MIPTFFRMIGVYALLHFLVDGLCVCCLYLMSPFLGIASLTGLFITYNVLAFLSQPLTGMVADKVRNKHWVLLAAMSLLTLAVLCAALSVSFYPNPSAVHAMMTAAVLLGLGNSLFHVWGGKLTAVRSGNDIRALGLFVSTGAFGLAVAVVFCSWLMLFGFLLAICCVAVLYLQRDQLLVEKTPDTGVGSSKKFRYSHVAVWVAIVALMVLVLFRSYIGESFSAGIHKGSAFVLAIGAVSMLGKMAGGWLAERWGIIRAMLFVLVAVLICLLFRDVQWCVPLVGLFMVNCTMPVTLYLANTVLEGKEGLAFGLLAAALMPGYLLAVL